MKSALTPMGSIALTLVLAAAASAQTHSWKGQNNGVSPQLWSIAANWTQGVPSGAGNALNFNFASVGVTSVKNDVASAFTIGFLGFGGQNWSLSGNKLSFIDGAQIGMGRSSQASIANDILMNGDLAISVGTGDALSLSGVISGHGSLTLSGSGDVTLANRPTCTGPLVVDSGVECNLQTFAPSFSSLIVNGGVEAGRGLSTGSLSGKGSIYEMNAIMTVGSSSDSRFDGSINGSGKIVKVGSGTLTLNGGVELAFTEISQGRSRSPEKVPSWSRDCRSIPGLDSWFRTT